MLYERPMLSPTEKETATIIRKLAERLYNTGYGWQVIVECMTDEEVIEEIKDSGMPSLEWAHWFAALQSERMDEVQAEVLDSGMNSDYVILEVNGEVYCRYEGAGALAIASEDAAHYVGGVVRLATTNEIATWPK